MSLQVSVIVPLYNRRAYVQLAVDSALSQNLENYEIIILDNQSTDGGYELCQELYGGNPRVRLVRHKFPCSLGASRNMGISLARGKYIAFLDSDDAYVKDGLKQMCEIAEATSADVVHAVGWLESLDDGGSTIKPDSKLQPRIAEPFFSLSTVSELNNDIQVRLNLFFGGKLNCLNVWSKIYLRDYLIENEITFADGLNEDVGFLILNLLNARRYVIAPILWNIYRISPDSRSFSKKDANFLSRIIDSVISSTRRLNEGLSSCAFIKDNPPYGDALRDFTINNLLSFNLYRNGLYGLYPANELYNICKQTLAKHISDADILEIVSVIFNQLGTYQAGYSQAVLENRALSQKIAAQTS